MASAHEHWSGESEVYALGALDGQELDSFESHLATNCAACRAYLHELQEALSLLPRSLRPVPAPAHLKTRILEQTHP
jgi:hypothetical protein